MSGGWEDSGHQVRLGKSGWQRQRDNLRILERDGYLCRVRITGVCTIFASAVDHRINLATGLPDLDDDANKRAVCPDCHQVLTQQQAVAGAAKRSRRRPQEQHPGLLP